MDQHRFAVAGHHGRNPVDEVAQIHRHDRERMMTLRQMSSLFVTAFHDCVVEPGRHARHRFGGAVRRDWHLFEKSPYRDQHSFLVVALAGQHMFAMGDRQHPLAVTRYRRSYTEVTHHDRRHFEAAALHDQTRFADGRRRRPFAATAHRRAFVVATHCGRCLVLLGAATVLTGVLHDAGRVVANGLQAVAARYSAAHSHVSSHRDECRDLLADRGEFLRAVAERIFDS